jgi:hypothetical protein
MNQADAALIPCGHCICVRCLDQLANMPAINPDHARSISRCPVCRSEVRDKLRLHFVL